ncbi:MAG: ABC transporter substrate-binding protein [Clostridia bacterium]|nr:ABC transporter substrate-binding protein [Clostridia bacterium]
MKRKIVFMSCLLAAVVSLSACGGAKTVEKGDNEAVTLRVAWWGGQPRHDSTIAVIDMYKAANPNVNIETEYTDWKGYWDKLATQMASKNLPDVIQQDYAYLGQWKQKNQVADLTEFVNSKVIDLSNISENYIGGNIDGGIYGISLGTNALSLMYNPAAYTAAGLSMPNENYTWGQFMSDAKKMKAAGFDTDLILSNDPKFFVEQRVRELGKTFYNADGTGLGFDDAKIVEDALKVQYDLVKEGISVDKDLAYSVQNIEDSLIIKKKVWGSMAWSNTFVPTEKLTKQAGFDLAITVVPKLDTAAKSGVYLKPSMLFSISNTSQNKKAAAKFINYFVNDVEANKVLAGERGVPVSSKIREALKPNLSDSEKKVYDYIDLVGKIGTPIDRPEPSGSGEVSKALKTIFQEIIYGTKTPADGAAEFMKTANEILAKNKA